LKDKFSVYLCERHFKVATEKELKESGLASASRRGNSP